MKEIFELIVNDTEHLMAGLIGLLVYLVGCLTLDFVVYQIYRLIRFMFRKVFLSKPETKPEQTESEA